MRRTLLRFFMALSAALALLVSVAGMTFAQVDDSSDAVFAVEWRVFGFSSDLLVTDAMHRIDAGGDPVQAASGWISWRHDSPFHEPDDPRVRSNSYIPGTYVLSFGDVGPEYEFWSISCDGQASDVSLEARSITVDLVPGSQADCSIVIGPARASVNVVVESDGAVTPPSLELEPDPFWPEPGRVTIDTSPTQIYPPTELTETATLTWPYTVVNMDPDLTFTGVSCDDDDSSGDPNTGRLDLDLDPGEDVLCTYHVSDHGVRVQVDFELPPGEATGVALRDPAGNTVYTGISSEGFDSDYWGGQYPGLGDVVPGEEVTLTVNDLMPDHLIVEASCDDGDSPSPSDADAATRTVVLRPDVGESLRCVFRAVRPQASASVRVETDYWTPEAFVFEPDWPMLPTITVDSGRERQVLPPTTIDSTMTAHWPYALRNPEPRYELVSIECADDDSFGDIGTGRVVFGFDPGEHVECVFDLADQTMSYSVDVSSLTDFATDTEFVLRDADGAIVHSETGRRGRAFVTIGEGQPQSAGETQLTLDGPGPGYRLESMGCYDDADSAVPSHADLGTRTLTIALEAGDHVVCYIEVADHHASATLAVEVDPPGGDDSFGLDTYNGFGAGMFSGIFSAFGVDRTPFPVSPGSPLTVIPPIPIEARASMPVSSLDVPESGYILTEITCDDADSSGDTDSGDVTFILDPGEDVTCTYHLVTGQGTFQVRVVGDEPVAEPASFTFSAIEDTVWSRDVSRGSVDYRFSGRWFAGDPVVVTMDDPAPAYAVSAITCDDDDSIGHPGLRQLTVTMDPDEWVRCTVELASQHVPFSVSVLPDRPLPAGTTFLVDDAADPENYLFLDPGWAFEDGGYVGTETRVLADPGPAFELTSIECDDGASATPSSGVVETRTLTLGLDAGEEVACVFHVRALVPATVKVVAESAAEIPGDFHFSLGGQYVPVGPNPDPFDSMALTLGTPGSVTALFRTEPPFQATFSVGNQIVDASALGVDVPVINNLGDYFPLRLDELPPDTQLLDIACTETMDAGTPGDVPPAASFVDVGGRTAYLGIDRDEVIECTFQVAPGLASAVVDDADSDGTDLDEVDEGSDSPNDAVNQRPTPKAGRWQSREVDSEVVCPFPIKAQKVGTQSGRLAVKAGGDKLTGTGFGSKKDLQLKRDPQRPDHYTGKAKVGDGAYKGQLKVDWKVETPERMTGTNKLSTKIQGKTCTITRTFEMQHQGN